MEYLNKPCLGDCNSFSDSYKLHDYLALKPMEYKNSIENYSEKVDYSVM